MALWSRHRPFILLKRYGPTISFSLMLDLSKLYVYASCVQKIVQCIYLRLRKETYYKVKEKKNDLFIHAHTHVRYLVSRFKNQQGVFSEPARPSHQNIWQSMFPYSKTLIWRYFLLILTLSLPFVFIATSSPIASSFLSDHLGRYHWVSIRIRMKCYLILLMKGLTWFTLVIFVARRHGVRLSKVNIVQYPKLREQQHG